MKKATVHEWNGMLLSLFHMDAGDKIDRHSHPFQHTTGVARGSSKVTIWWPEWGDCPEKRIVNPGDKDFPFPPNVEHEIEAIEDGTIIVNLSRIEDQPDPGVPGQDGGIAYDS